MYIKFLEIFSTLALFAPLKMRKKIRNIGYNLKVSQNLNYISKNRKRVISHLKDKFKKGEKLNVAFYIYDETKWKNQSIYDLMEKSDIFKPYIFVTKNCAPKENFNYQASESLVRVYDFFKAKNMRVKYAYDFKKDFFIPFDEMDPKPDIIFYCHPWYIYKTQGPVMSSKYALSYYVPYSVSSSMGQQEYYLRFHLYVGTQYVINDLIKKYFSENMENKGANLKVAGHPILDYFYLNKNNQYEDKKSIIYAPHFSVTDDTILKWGTFLDMGEFILDWAKKHPEFNWIYKPHPCLKGFLRNKNLWPEEKIQKYWDEWNKIGQVYESGDYLKMFMESRAMITDCGSFKTEYFMTQKPQIFLKSKNGMPFNPSVEKINQTCYKAENTEELENILQEVLIKGNDYLKDARAKVYCECGYENNFAAKNIIDDIKNTLEAVQCVK